MWWAWKISKKNEIISLNKNRKLFMMKYKKRIRSNLLLPESIKALWSMDHAWKKWRPGISKYLLYLRNLLEIIKATEAHLATKLITNRAEYSDLLKQLIVEGLIKMLEPVVRVR